MTLLLVFFLYLFCNVQYSFSLSEENLLPVIIKSSKNAECQKQALDLFNSFMNGEEWAWQMIDASSKIPSGIYMGNNRDLGSYDECLKIDNAGHSNINGKYCFAGISILMPKSINISSLINNTSTSSNFLESSLLGNINNLYQEWDVSELLQEQKIIDKLLRQDWTLLNADISLNMTIPDNVAPIALSLCLPDACLPSDLDLPNSFLLTDDFCVTKESFKTLELYDYLAISFFVLIFVIIVISTIYDVQLSNSKKSPVKKILTSFSVYTNGKELVKTTKNPNHLLCIDGIKVLSTLWVILGHKFNASLTAVTVNTNDIVTMSEKLYSQYIQSALYAVDTFMVLSGCLMAYLSLKSMSHMKEKFEKLSTSTRIMKMTSFTLFTYIYRYLRLTPAIAALFIFYVTLLQYIGTGPLYHYFMDPSTKVCVNNWWSLFLYLENYLHPAEQCIPQLWYVDVDMHVFLLSPLILWPIVYYPKKMLYFGLPILSVISCVVVFTIVYVKNIEWATSDYLKYFYFPTHTRLTPWLLGIGLGTILHNYRNTKFHIKKLHNLLIWVVVLAALVLLILGQQDTSYNYERLKTSVWTTINKPLWSLCICWIIWACVKGHGGIINSFLSCNLFQIVSKLTFCMYLVHLMVIMINKAEAKVPIYFDDKNLLRAFLADVVITTFVATIWTLAFEIPFRVIEKTLIGGFVRKDPQPSNVIEENKKGDLSAETHKH